MDDFKDFSNKCDSFRDRMKEFVRMDEENDASIILSSLLSFSLEISTVMVMKGVSTDIAIEPYLRCAKCIDENSKLLEGFEERKSEDEERTIN